MNINKLKNRSGSYIALLISVTPIALWALAGDISLRFQDRTSTMTSMGQIAGLLGLSLFSVTLILSSRLKIFESFFGGLDKMYKTHHKFGVFALLFLLIHPLLLAYKYFILISATSAALFLLPNSDWAKNLGIISLLLLMLLIVVTMFSAFRYQVLRSFHKILGFAMFLGALHAFLIPSDISRYLYLKIFMLLLVGSALTAYTYRTLLGKFFVKKFDYSVIAVNKIKDDVTEVVMKPVTEKMSYLPGQFIFINFLYGGIDKEVHPFSISSAPHEEDLRITVKSLGDYTGKLGDLKIGSIAKIEGPYGKFSYLNSHSKEQIWIAGGIGVTPFLNMMRNLRHEQKGNYKIDMYYCTKTEDEFVFLNELDETSRSVDGFRLIPYCSDQKGFLNTDSIKELSGDVNKKDIFICGPPMMMQSLKNQFLKLKIPKYRMHLEEFKLL